MFSIAYIFLLGMSDTHSKRSLLFRPIFYYASFLLIVYIVLVVAASISMLHWNTTTYAFATLICITILEEVAIFVAKKRSHVSWKPLLREYKWFISSILLFVISFIIWNLSQVRRSFFLSLFLSFFLSFVPVSLLLLDGWTSVLSWLLVSRPRGLAYIGWYCCWHDVHSLENMHRFNQATRNVAQTFVFCDYSGIILPIGKAITCPPTSNVLLLLYYYCCCTCFLALYVL